MFPAGLCPALHDPTDNLGLSGKDYPVDRPVDRFWRIRKSRYRSDSLTAEIARQRCRTRKRCIGKGVVFTARRRHHRCMTGRADTGIDSAAGGGLGKPCRIPRQRGYGATFWHHAQGNGAGDQVRSDRRPILRKNAENRSRTCTVPHSPARPRCGNFWI